MFVRRLHGAWTPPSLTSVSSATRAGSVDAMDAGPSGWIAGGGSGVGTPRHKSALGTCLGWIAKKSPALAGLAVGLALTVGGASVANAQIVVPQPRPTVVARAVGGFDLASEVRRLGVQLPKAPAPGFSVDDIKDARDHSWSELHY